MALNFNRLSEYPLNEVWEVKNGNAVLGLIENEEGHIEWKAFLGSGFSCKYLAKYYSRCAAVRAIVKMAAEL